MLPSNDRRPFKLRCDDYRPGNILLKFKLEIVLVIDCFSLCDLISFAYTNFWSCNLLTITIVLKFDSNVGSLEGKISHNNSPLPASPCGVLHVSEYQAVISLGCYLAHRPSSHEHATAEMYDPSPDVLEVSYIERFSAKTGPVSHVCRDRHQPFERLFI